LYYFLNKGYQKKLDIGQGKSYIFSQKPGGKKMRLKGKVAIITGAGRGIGRAYALRFAAEGAKVTVADIIWENARKVAEEIKNKGGEALPLGTDVSSESSTQEMAQKTVEQYGRIDILLNNAAIFYGLGTRKWDSWTSEEWDRILTVNIKGTWLCIKAVVPHMISQSKGKIINISSSTTEKGTTVLIPYTSSKGAVSVLTTCMAKALGQYNITVNCISPGYTITPATIEMPGRFEGMDEMLIKDRCIRRAEQPEDLVGTAVFLASEDSDFVTGEIIKVDGGETIC
jgi:3-oxoacyl-[acyl-carrier protein] reductase